MAGGEGSLGSPTSTTTSFSFSLGTPRAVRRVRVWFGLGSKAQTGEGGLCGVPTCRGCLLLVTLTCCLRQAARRPAFPAQHARPQPSGSCVKGKNAWQEADAISEQLLWMWTHRSRKLLEKLAEGNDPLSRQRQPFALRSPRKSAKPACGFKPR
eukprot:2234224-Rhodomonas_salina.2